MILQVQMGFPLAARRLVIIAAVYAIIEGLKLVPLLTHWLKRWKCILLNILLTSIGIVSFDLPVGANRNAPTVLVLILISMLASSGLHGIMETMTRTDRSTAYLKLRE